MGEKQDSPWHSAGRTADSGSQSAPGSSDWSEDVARAIAAKEELELTDEHWAVIHFLRQHYEREGVPPNGRALLRSLEHAFEASGGRKILYRLFPQGPVAQGCRIAGLQIPDQSIDRSFGTAL